MASGPRRRGPPPALDGAAVVSLDRARIESALEARRRYKYVHPRVQPATDGAGWQIVSPNCSRSVDKTGGEIPIAWLQPLPDGQWQLLAREHAQALWVCKWTAPTLPAALERLVEDPLKEFWQ